MMMMMMMMMMMIIIIIIIHDGAKMQNKVTCQLPSSKYEYTYPERNAVVINLMSNTFHKIFLCRAHSYG